MKKRPNDKVKGLVRGLESCSHEELKTLAYELANDHNTHQQKMGYFVYNFLVETNVKTKKGFIDARNKETAAFAETALNTTGERYFPFI